MTATCWSIGQRIIEREQGGRERAAYGQALLKRLSADLSARFGRGYSERNLEQMRLSYLAWFVEKISQPPSAKSPDLPSLAKAFPLPWSAYVRLLAVRNAHARAFYETEALRSGWTVSQPTGTAATDQAIPQREAPAASAPARRPDTKAHARWCPWPLSSRPPWPVAPAA